MATKAFLVGINDYLPQGLGGPDLQGCVNDVRDMANTLVVIGFSPKNMQLCTDQRATKSNILKGLTWLIQGARKGDSLIFFYSGHGSQIADISGDETVDKKDEILCPHDISFSDNVYITDDDLTAIISRLNPGATLDIILDCCHSGTGTREAELLENAKDRIRTRYMVPPVDYTFHIDYDPNLLVNSLLKRTSRVREINITPTLNHSLWTACRDNQVSEETMINGTVRGVFTYHLCRVLRRTNGNITRRKLNSLVSAAISRAGFVQVPQLEVAQEEMLEKPFRAAGTAKAFEIGEEEIM